MRLRQCLTNFRLCPVHIRRRRPIRLSLDEAEKISTRVVCSFAHLGAQAPPLEANEDSVSNKAEAMAPSRSAAGASKGLVLTRLIQLPPLFCETVLLPLDQPINTAY